ncbi:MAG TPA: hypothetical protein VJR89_36935 [Polyangiales bacterium]|nr:hypothetical protein [Polyangiales bacterium]
MRRAVDLLAFSIFGVLAGCSEDPAGTAPPMGAQCVPGSVGCTTSTPTTPTPAAAGTGGPGHSTAGGPVTPPIAIAGTGAPTAVAGGGAPTPMTGGMEGVPCEVAKVVSDRCTLCHASKPQGGAPMPLMTLKDFQAMSKTLPTMTVAQLVPGRVNATEQARLMPPVGSTMPLMAAEKMMLSNWASSGAKGVTSNACAITEPSGDITKPPTTMGKMGGASLEPIEYNDPEMKCYKFLTHGQGSMDTPYSHGPGEEYVNFTFKAPWTTTVYTRAHKIVLGDAPILHHWLLYIDPRPGQDGGIQGGSLGIHPSSNLLHAWAPGASELYFDPDVGMKLEATVGLTLEAHINNSTGKTGQDHNGAEICVTTKVPEHVVDMTWTGTESLGGTTASGTCTPRSQNPINIIAWQPHMHKKGTHMKVVINRKGGMKEILHDEDFNFDNQRYYVRNVVLMPGDTFTTTCTYSSPATFGQSTSNEMCYFFPIAWPAGSMASGSGIHGPTTCLR